METIENGISRRNFFRSAAAAAGVVAAGTAGAALLGGCASETAKAPAQGEEIQAQAASPATREDAPDFDKTVDIVVMGAGIGGLMSSYVATDAGKSVLLVEPSSELGGSILISNGNCQAGVINSVDEVATVLPTGDQKLCRAYVDEWLRIRDDDIWNIPEVNLIDNSLDHPTLGHIVRVCWGTNYDEKRANMELLGKVISDAGGEIMLDTFGDELIADEDGNIVGAVLVGKDGSVTRVGCQAVILATGGFVNNKEMLTRYFGVDGDKAVLRACAYNRGDAIRMATAHGAALSKGFGKFYCNAAPWPSLVPDDAEEYNAADKQKIHVYLGAVQNWTNAGIVLNCNGKRFFNESASGDFLGAEIIKQPMGRAYLVLDETKVSEVKELFDTLVEAGMVVDTADTIEGLAEALAKRGVDARNAAKTLQDCANGEVGDVSNDALAVLAAPYYAIQIGTAISGTYGGLKINERAEVINVRDKPIRGLYAVPYAAGGLFADEYGGSHGVAITFGKIAADSAVAAIG